MKLNLAVLSLISILILSSCEQKKEESLTDNLLMATLYNYYATEYKALTHQAFNVAKDRLMVTRLHNPKTKNLAIVVDIDETILDNSPYEAKMILDEKGYDSDSWNEWCDLAAAEAVPGALEFLKYADSLDFQIFYLSNRKKEFNQTSTIVNLRKLGFPQMDEDHFLLRDAERSKVKRRKAILKKHKIVMLVGDNLGDFYQDSDILSERAELFEDHKDLFGSKFIMLPNAMYGAWVPSIGLNNTKNSADSLLKIMIKPYQE